MTERSRNSLYDAAEALLGTKDRRKVDRNTYLERRDEGAGYPAHIALKYHRTDVLRFIPDAADAAGYVELDTDGWHTTTTWGRMSMFGLRLASSGKAGIVVYPVGAGWDTGGFPYYDGLRLTADGTALCDDQPALRPFMGPVYTRSGWNGMRPSESRAVRSRMIEALYAGDADGYSDARRRLQHGSQPTQTLQPDRIAQTPMGSAAVYTMSSEMIQGCAHLILVPSHYRSDGSCRCDDATHSEMKEWGYTWNDTDGRWTA